MVLKGCQPQHRCTDCVLKQPHNSSYLQRENDIEYCDALVQQGSTGTSHVNARHRG